ncbi:snRNA-activating protein complex subunit 1b [Trichomycterus rosablanca]|uniref:snRNA-activating protein complex subunit 1b n=1 Tax=Trichomycterus rosablanca TaxID=2290929 RepID=UPI002F35776F
MEYYKDKLKTDCEEILRRFQATASVRFEEFSAIWREMKFSHVFYGLLELNATRNFTRLALSTAYPYLLPPYSFQIRVGGLYLLYGLYNAQLITPKEKIRLALKDWDDLMRFKRDAIDAQHYDVGYILKKLQSDKAFCFTAMPKPLCFTVKKKRIERREPLCESFVDRPSRPQELISSDMLEELANVHEHYEGLKKAVSVQPDQSDLNLIKQNLEPRLRNSVLTFYNWQQNQTNQDDGDAGEGTSSQDESSRRAQLLASIKSRSYGQAVEASKSRRHRQIELTSAATEPTQRTSTCKRPLSLKEHTETCLMTDDLNKELLSSTKLWRLTNTENENTEEKKKRRFNWKESAR